LQIFILSFRSGFAPQEQKDYDSIFRIDPYGNVISLFAKPNSPVAPTFDHFFPYIRGGRTRDRSGSKETNIILIQWKANSKKSDVIEQLIPPHFVSRRKDLTLYRQCYPNEGRNNIWRKRTDIAFE
jgi:hypothetical protein